MLFHKNGKVKLYTLRNPVSFADCEKKIVFLPGMEYDIQVKVHKFSVREMTP